MDKLRALGADKVYLCERGTSFGYQNLVVDFLGMLEVINSETPLIFTCHATATWSLGWFFWWEKEGHLMPFARAGLCHWALRAFFFGGHPDPDRALCDGQCALSLDKVPEFIGRFQGLIR